MKKARAITSTHIGRAAGLSRCFQGLKKGHRVFPNLGKFRRHLFQVLKTSRRDDSPLDALRRNFDHPAVSWLREITEGVVVNVRVVPRAPRSMVQGVLGGALKIRLAAPPVEGKANAELVRFLAEELDLHAGRVQLLAGATGRNKRVLIQGLSRAAIAAKLTPR